MSVIKVQKLIGLSDKNFNIEMPEGAVLNIQGGFAQDVNSSLKLPVGTTDQRPTNPNAGTIRYNSTLGTVEGYNGSLWTNLMIAEQPTEEVEESTIPERGLVMHMDANNPNSLKPNATDQDANYWYNLRQNNLHFGIPTDRIAQESINGQVVKYLDFSVDDSGCAKLVSTGNYIDSPWYPYCSIVMFMRWRTDDTNWRTVLRSRGGDHAIMGQRTNRNLGVYDNNGQGFQDSGYDIDQFPDWDTKFNMYTWRLSSYESGPYSPNYQCFLNNETNARATLNVVASRYDRGFYHFGAWGRGNRDPHSSTQNAGSFAVFMYYNRHITQAERAAIYDTYKETFDI